MRYREPPRHRTSARFFAFLPPRAARRNAHLFKGPSPVPTDSGHSGRHWQGGHVSRAARMVATSPLGFEIEGGDSDVERGRVGPFVGRVPKYVCCAHRGPRFDPAEREKKISENLLRRKPLLHLGVRTRRSDVRRSQGVPTLPIRLSPMEYVQQSFSVASIAVSPIRARLMAGGRRISRCAKAAARRKS